MKRRPYLFFVFLLLLGIAASRNYTQGQKAPALSLNQNAGKASTSHQPLTTSPRLQTHRNLGKAYYEQGKYAEALDEFGKVVTSGRALATDYLDLGLAQMQLGKYDEALGSFTTAKQMDSSLTAVDYNLGILYKREGHNPDADSALRRVIQTDPNDPAAWFNLGSVLMSEGKLDLALDAFNHVLKMGFNRGQNFYVVSLFRTHRVLVLMNRPEEAQKYLALHAKYRGRVPDVSLQTVALEAGRYGAMLLPAAPVMGEAPLPPARVSLVDVTARLGLANISPQPSHGAPRTIAASRYSLDFARENLVGLFGSSIAVGDYDGDGRPDLYLANPTGKNRLLHSNVNGTLDDVTEEAGVAGPGASLAATFADYDNSGRPSLFVVGLGGVTFYHNRGDSTFTDETEKAGLKGAPDELATSAVVFDADNDGLLDLLVTVYTDFSRPPQKSSFEFPQDFAGAVSHLYRNNGDGTFSEITKSAGLEAAFGRTRGAVFADFNDDGFADLLLFRDDGPPLLYLNQGGANFTARSQRAFRTPAYTAQVADFNHDGSFDLVLWTKSGYEVLLNRGDATFVPVKGLPEVLAPDDPFAHRGTVADVYGNGYDDLLIADATSRLHLVVNRGGVFQEASLSTPTATQYSSVIPAWLENPGNLDFFATTRDGRISVLRKEGAPAHWLEINLKGEKSNQQGVGALLEVKAGNFYEKLMVTTAPTRVFTGTLQSVDVVRITWPNQIVQNAIQVNTNGKIEIHESERLASSCPLLYGWDGQKYAFITDVLGAAPLGELSPDGSLIAPNPQEYVRLPRSLQPQHGRYIFHFTDEMREVDYFDHVQLFAVDHPAQDEIYANEIYSSSVVRPTLYVIREKHSPVSAVDDDGRSVLPLLLHADGEYVAGFERKRILGLANLHTLTLDLGPFPNASSLALWLQGWVFWPDSNSARALSTQKTQMIGPYLQVRNPQGEWVTVIPEMGLPSGTNRAMRVELTGKFLSPDHHVRIVTNLCVYWDQIFFAADEVLPLKPIELPMLLADLRYRGFSTPLTDSQHVKPDRLEYTSLDPSAPWDPARGNYTRYGGVRQLLTRSDDRLVVIAPGDELTVSFDAGHLPSVEPSSRRDFFLLLDGWAKDGEPNTVSGSSSGPLPLHVMRHYPYQRSEYPAEPGYQLYLRQYETRPGYRLSPPLAPQRPSL